MKTCIESLPIGTMTVIHAVRILREKDGTYSVWSRGQCSCQEPDHRGLDVDRVVALVQKATG